MSQGDSGSSEYEGLNEIIENAYRFLKYLAFPPLLIYRGAEETWEMKLRRGWWLYVTFFVLTIPLLRQRLMVGEYDVLASFPWYHLVVVGALIMTVAPTMLTGVPMDWPAALAAPSFFPDAPMLAGLALTPVVVGGYGLFRASKQIGGDGMAVPMTRTDETSDGAPKRPVFEYAVSTLLIGESGAGKSSALKLLAYQQDYDSDVATFTHDMKEEFWEFFTRWTDLEIERIAIEDGTAIWNLFLDVENPRQFTEISKAVMGDKQGNDPFYTPATQVLADAMVHLHQKGEQEEEMPTHADLLRFLNQSPEEIYHALDEDGLSAASSIHPDANGSLNVHSRIKEGANEVFVGDFAKAGDFSLREYIENPAGRVVIFDTPTDEIETVGPMYSLLLDTSIKFGMTSDTEVNYLLDEIDELPRMSRLSSLASGGRGMGVRALLGIQTVGQLRATYGDDVSGILGNCPQGIYFAPGESSTIEYVLSEVGEMRETVVTTTENTRRGEWTPESSSKTERETDRTPITSGLLKQFEEGDCVVKTRGNWWVGKVAQLEDVYEKLGRPRDDD
jgi:hypothetical protein